MIVLSDEQVETAASLLGVSGEGQEVPSEERVGALKAFIEAAANRVDGQRVKEKENGQEAHPSYGMVRLTNGRSSSQHLFQSSVRPDRVVTLTISGASVRRELGQDWLFSEQDLVEVEMTNSQFADMISSMNSEGSACTISRVGGFPVAPPPERPGPTEQHKQEFKQKVREITGRLQSLRKDATEQLRGKGSLKVAERKEIASRIDSLVQEFEANLPFISEQFDRSMTKAMDEYTNAVRAFSSDLMRRSGGSLDESPKPELLAHKSDGEQ